MARKNKEQPAPKPALMRWEFDSDIPTHDFLNVGPLDEAWNLQQAVGNFVWSVDRGDWVPVGDLRPGERVQTLSGRR